MNNLDESSGVANGAMPGTHHPVDGPGSAWPTGDSAVAPAAADLLQRVVQGSHASIDRFADAAAPTVQRWSDHAASIEAALQQNADALRELPEAWSDTMRQTVRSNPLLSLAAAVGLGALIVRVAR